MNQQSMNQNPQQHLLNNPQLQQATSVAQQHQAQQQHNLVDQNAEYEYRPPHMLQQQQQNNNTANFMGGGSGAAPGGVLNNNSGINSVHAIMRGNNQQQGNNMNAGVVGNITAGGSSSHSSSSTAAHLVHGQQNMLYHANTNSKNNNAGTTTNPTHTQSNSIQNLDEQYEYRPPPRANNKPAPNFVTSGTNALQQSNSSSAASLFQHSNNPQQRLNNQNNQQGTSGGTNNAANNSNYNFNPPPAPVGAGAAAGMNSNRHSTSSKGAQATSNANSYKGSSGGAGGGQLHQGQQHQHHNPHSGGGNPGPNSSGLHATYSQNSQWSSDATYSQHSGPVVNSAGGNNLQGAYQQQLYNQGKQQSVSGGFHGPTQGSKNTMAQQQEQIQWTDVSTTNQHKGSGGGLGRYNQQFGAGSLGQQHGSGDNQHGNSIRSDSINWHQHASILSKNVPTPESGWGIC